MILQNVKTKIYGFGGNSYKNTFAAQNDVWQIYNFYEKQLF